MYRRTIPKGVGTALEHEFRAWLQAKYQFKAGSSAKGIDFLDIGVDMKATLATNPQSSCRYTSAEQKKFGPGFHVLVFLYKKRDSDEEKAAFLEIQKTIFVSKERTADYTLTQTLQEHLDADANDEDLIGLIRDRHLPLTDKEMEAVVKRLREKPLLQGYLGISPAYQWRLKYKVAAKYAGQVDDVVELV